MPQKNIKKYEKESGLVGIVGTMACDSNLRTLSYMRTGCNTFDGKRPQSRPLSFWYDEDIWNYIKLNNLDYAKVYDMGYKGTGCMFCMFGCHLEKGENRFERMKKTHPIQYNYCINKLGLGKVLDLIKVRY